MNSFDLEDDEIVALEPPLVSRSSSLSANTRSRSPRNSFHYNHAYDRHTDDDDGMGGGYDSDRIDPELEELLYASVHHQTVNSMELSFDVASKHDNHQNEPSNETPVKSDIKPSTETTPEKSIPASHDGFAIFNNRKSVKKELKDIKRAKKVATDAAAAQFTIDEKTAEKGDLDLSFGYLVNGSNLETTLDPIEAMNKFYNEDDYDSDDERRKVKRMSSDRRFWKINQEDMLANMRRRSGSTRGRNQQCRSCGGYGHLVKECPRREVCFICGDSRHVGQKCPCRVCSICFLPGHLSFKCPVRYDLKDTFCGGCRQSGHKEDNCTQGWRKFLAITDAPTYLANVNSKSPLAGDPVMVNENISCSNCGSRGQHFACECPQKTMDNLRFQIPAPVMNWRAIRKEQANHRPARLPKGRPRKSLSQPGSFTSMPSTSTTSSSTYQNGYSPSKAASKFPNPNNKRPWNEAASSPELITLDSDSDVDSDDSVQYVLSLLKNSTQVNDSPMSSDKKRFSAKDKHPHKAPSSSKATATSEASILNISTKKKTKNQSKKWPKKQKKAATFNSSFTPTPQFVGVQASKGKVTPKPKVTQKPKFKKKKPKNASPSTPLMEAAKILAVSHMKRRLSSKKSKQIAKLKATAKKH